MNPQDILSQLDEVQQHLRTTLAISDLLSCMTTDPPLENTVQETGQFMVSSIQHSIEILATIRSHCNAIIEEEFPHSR